MATIKAGTYRFNDVLTSSYYPEEPVNVDFTVDVVYEGLSVTAICTGLYLANIDDGLDRLYFVSVTPGFAGDIAVWSTGGWYVDVFGTGIQTITIPTDSEVSAEFHAWFTANAVEVVQISGVWKFKDKLSAPNTEVIESVNFSFVVSRSGADTQIEGSIIKLLPQISYPLDVYFKWETSNVDLSSLGITLPYTFCMYGNLESVGWYTSWYGEDIKTIDFGTEPQTVSAEFYEWLTANATQPTAKITYNGSAIANLFGGQTATVKCGGMKMETDLVVEVAEQTGGECNHEVYELPSNYENTARMILKRKVDRPTAEQSAKFVNNSLVFMTPDVENVFGITQFDYQIFEIAEGVSFPMLYFRVPLSLVNVSLYYIWEDDVDLAKMALSSFGIDASNITGEGWYAIDFVNGSVYVLTDTDFDLVDLTKFYPYIIPYGDYFDSLFDIYINSDGEPADRLDTSHSMLSFNTQNKLCNKDIFVNVGDASVTYNTSEDGEDLGGVEIEYDRYYYIDVDVISNNMSKYDIQGWSFLNRGGTVQSFIFTLYDKRTSVMALRWYTYGIIIRTYNNNKIGTVYTNANIISQTDDKVYITGLRHNTYIVIVDEETTE